jgi:hypothetical protein
MEATAFDILNIISLGLIAGTAVALVIGYATGIGRDSRAAMTAKRRLTMVLLILACSSVAIALLSWYLFQYLAGGNLSALS